MQTPFFSAPPPLFFPVERQGGRKKKKKGARPWHYEAFTRAFTSDRLEIIRPVTSHNTKIMRVFTPTLSLSSFFLFLLFTAVKEGLRKLPEFLSSPPAPPPPHPPEETPPSRRSGTIFTLLFFSLFFSAAENVFPYP